MKDYETKNFALVEQQQQQQQQCGKKPIADMTNCCVLNTNEFDVLIIREWKRAMQMGLFRYKLDRPLPSRYTSGKYSILIQLNPNRLSHKRPSEIKQTDKLNQEFDANKFNFTRIDHKEILFRLESESNKFHLKLITHHESELRKDSHYVIINNSPIELGHVLIVPRLANCLNQVITQEAIEIAAKFSVLSNSNQLIMGFNSVNAYSSVNHLHLHAYYINNNSYDRKYPLSVQNITHAELISRRLWFLNDECYYFAGFSLQLCDFHNNLDEFSKYIFTIVNYLSKNNIAHNLALVKADTYQINTKRNQLNGDVNNLKVTSTLRAVIWPKKASYEVPNNEKNIPLALCELSGQIMVSNENDFEQLDEEYVVELAKQTSLEKFKMSIVKRDIQILFNNKES